MELMTSFVSPVYISRTIFCIKHSKTQELRTPQAISLELNYGMSTRINLQGIFDVCLCFISSKRAWTFCQYIYIINTRWKVTYLKVLPLLCIDIDNIWWEVTHIYIKGTLTIMLHWCHDHCYKTETKRN